MYAGLSTVIVYACAQKRAKYALGEPKLGDRKKGDHGHRWTHDVKDMCMHVKEILSHLLTDAEARSQ